MRKFVSPLLTIALSMLPTLAHAQYASAQASAQAGLYATPQAALAPAYGTCPNSAAAFAPAYAPAYDYNAAALADVLAALQSYVPPQQELRTVERVYIPQPVYIPAPSRTFVYSPYVAQRSFSQRSFAPAYGVPAAAALASVGYGGGVANNNVIVNRGLVANGLGGRQRAQRTVSRSKAVTVTGRPGLLNRALGR